MQALGFKYEPAAIAEALRLTLIALALGGVLHLDDKVILAIVGAVSAVLTLFVRQSVVSQATLERAGTSMAEVTATANRNTGDGGDAPTTPPRNLRGGGRGPGAGSAAILLPFIVAGMAFSSACANRMPANATPQMKVAKYGGDVLASAHEIQKFIAAVGEANPSLQPQVAKAMASFIELEKAGNRLADALSLYDAAQSLIERQNAATTVSSVLKVISDTLIQITVPIGDDKTRVELARLLANVSRTILTIQSLVPNLNPNVPPATPPSQGELELQLQPAV